MSFALWQYPVHLLATGFGAGLAPVAPGTAGTLAGVVVFRLAASLNPLPYIAVAAMLFVYGIFICGQTAVDYGAMDPGFIVYDEIVGFMVAMFAMPAQWGWICAGFVVYRVFDIWKPFPIEAAEAELGPGLAIMADDAIAGLYALAILQAARFVVERVRR